MQPAELPFAQSRPPAARAADMILTALTCESLTNRLWWLQQAQDALDEAVFDLDDALTTDQHAEMVYLELTYGDDGQRVSSGPSLPPMRVLE